MPTRQFVLQNAASKGADMVPMGTAAEVTRALARFNTAPDGSRRSSTSATAVLHGPGMIVEFPTATDEVTQAMVIVKDEDFAWPVLTRICKELNWALIDLESGRRFG